MIRRTPSPIRIRGHRARWWMAGIVPKHRRWMRNVAIPLLLVELFMFADLEYEL